MELPALLITLAAMAPLPHVELVHRDAHACGQPVLVQKTPVTLRVSPALCIRDAFPAKIEDEHKVHVVLLVETPQAPGELHVFVYNLVGATLEPRFLGSGFTHASITDARPFPGGTAEVLELLLQEHGSGRSSVVRCHFLPGRFPLQCDPVEPQEP